jgi:hypothetical protein
VTIKNPPVAVEEAQAGSARIGEVIDVPPGIGLLMIAAGWVRSETRSRIRRERDSSPGFNRRGEVDRRSD